MAFTIDAKPVQSFMHPFKRTVRRPRRGAWLAGPDERPLQPGSPYRLGECRGHSSTPITSV